MQFWHAALCTVDCMPKLYILQKLHNKLNYDKVII